MRQKEALVDLGVPELNEDQKYSQLKTIQTLNTIAFIAGPVSLIIGGVLLGSAALVCAIVALVKIRRVISPEDDQGSMTRTLYIQSIVALSITIVAFALNLYAFITAMITLIPIIQSGDYSQLLNAITTDGTITGGGNEASQEGSIWDR